MDDNKPGEEEIVFSDQQRIIVLIVMEMTLGVIGIFINLMVVSTVRNEDSLQEDTNHLLLANICFSNLVVSFLVKPISAIYVSYALSTGEWKVGLAFCSLYTLAFRTTWLVFPFTMVALCWNSLTTLCCLTQPRGSVVTQDGAGAIINIHSDQQTVQSFQSDKEFQRTKRSLAFPTIRQKSIIGCVWAFATLYGLAACFPEKVKIEFLQIFLLYSRFPKEIFISKNFAERTENNPNIVNIILFSRYLEEMMSPGKL